MNDDTSAVINENSRREFERAWGSGSPRPIEEFLPCPDDPQYLPTLEELVHVDLEFSWKHWKRMREKGQLEEHAVVTVSCDPPSVLHHLERFPELRERTILARLFDQEAHCWAMFAAADDPKGSSSYGSSPIQLSVHSTGPFVMLGARMDANASEHSVGEGDTYDLQRRASWLRHVPILEKLPHDLVLQLAADAAEQQFSCGTTIVEQGGPCPGLIVIVQGLVSIKVRSEDESGATVLQEAGAGTVLGELSLITGSTCTASIRAITDVVAWTFSPEQCRRLMESSPSFANVCRRLGSRRLGRAKIDAFCGKLINGYRLIEVLGKGSMGIVYKAVHVGEQGCVALKMLKPSMAFQPRVVTRFRREADILRQLRHPHILQFIDEFEAAGTLFTVIEFCEGQTLEAIIKAHGRLELGVVKQIVGQLASALLASHGQGVVHRDLKPANVMIATSGEVKLADFGVALLRRNPGLTRHTEMLGTPRYMAPEQLLGEPAKPETDVFALACITYEMLVGRPAQPGNSLAEIMEGVQRNLWPSPEIFSDVKDPQVRAFLARALRRSPAERELDLGLLAQWA